MQLPLVFMFCSGVVLSSFGHPAPDTRLVRKEAKRSSKLHGDAETKRAFVDINHHAVVSDAVRTRSDDVVVADNTGSIDASDASQTHTSWQHGYLETELNPSCIEVEGDFENGKVQWPSEMYTTPTGCWRNSNGMLLWLAHVRNDKPFSSIRYCDGEWIAMKGCNAGEDSASCSACHVVSLDGLPCNKEMLESLVHGVSAKYRNMTAPINNGWQYLQIYGGYLDMWNEQSKINQWRIGHWFWEFDIMHNFVRGGGPWLEALAYMARTHHTIAMVGPRPLRRLCKVLPYEKYVQIPYRHRDGDHVASTMEKVKHELTAFFGSLEGHKSAIVFVSMSLMSKKVILDLLPITKGKHFLLEVGSAFDPIINDPEIDGHRRMPYGDPKTWQPGYLKPNAASLSTLRKLVSDYKDKSDAELQQILAAWVQSPKSISNECLNDDPNHVSVIS